MRKPALLLISAVIFAAGLPSAAWADLARGRQAYQKKNYKLAFTELSPDARRGKPEAMYLLGKMYAEGQGIGRDDAQAFEWFQKAADANYAPAQGMLGMFYAQGRGATRDNTKSIEWARRAAENGDALSQYMMGVRSLDGLGVPKSADDAVTWFGTAAEQNYALAQYALGVLIGFGPSAQGEFDKQRDFRVEGAKWLILAVRQNSAEIPNGQAKLDELKKRMLPPDIAAAEKRAQAWKPTAPK
ncbi:MAG: Sel1 domain protein repeat-containing protein [Betaproteobacteria bacterium]|nr:Sel1 domain protein repeat-containing protein [Betaproteobacteria bacterium]